MKNIAREVVVRILVICAVIGLFVWALRPNTEIDKSFLQAKDAPFYNRNQPDIIRKYEALVRIVDRKTGRTICSGAVISDDYVLTAAHCFVEAPTTDESDVFVVGQSPQGGNSAPVIIQLIAYNSGADYAILKGNFKDYNRAPVADAPYLFFATKGPLLTCGYPYNSAAVCYPTGSQLITYYAQVKLEGRLFPGMSGGPVVDLSTGTIIAVNTAVGDGFIVISPVIGLFDNLGIPVINK